MSHEGTRQARDRGAARSKAEKARPPTVPVPQVEIVPGRLNEAEWIALTALEEGEDVVGDILADLLTRVLDSAFKVYLTQQCVPFIISQAKEAMLQITEWRFLVRDEGEPAVAENPTWSEDLETTECTIDAWAQGSVPVLQAPAPDDYDEEEGGNGQDAGNLDQSCLDSVCQAPRASLEEHSAELGISPGPQPAPGPLLEAEPEDTLEESSGPETYHLFSSESWNESMSVEVGPADLAPEPSHAAIPQWSAEKGAPCRPFLVLEDFHDTQPRLDEAGDQLLYSSDSVFRLTSSSEGPRQPRPAASFQPPLQVEPDASHPRMGYQAALTRLDPAKLPCPWVRPLAEILVSDPQAHPLDVYHGRRRGKRVQVQAKPQPPEAPVDPNLYEPRAVHSPFQPRAPLSLLGPDPRFQRPNLYLDLPTPFFRSRSPVSSSRLRFEVKHPALSDVTRSTSPKLWPGAKWPSGWEGEAELLGELWADRTQVASRVLRSLAKEDQDSGELETVPQVLEATSQVLWKPMVLTETIKLAPGVRMWNQSAQRLPASTLPLEEGTPPSDDRCPIQTGLPKQRMAETQPTKFTAPKVWLLPSKSEPSSKS